MRAGINIGIRIAFEHSGENMLILRNIKFFFQRLIRGWDDSETWNIDITFAKLMLPRMRRFKELNCGHPSSLSDEEWNVILDKIISSLEYHASNDKWKSLNADKYQEGIDLFAKYYAHLWW